mmetsp:Transcript_54665/g.129166  ORF Transcript_54665/g.129166 Transcript_54665/m.129166 type:complete len:84 (+) Transcript_54665:153-404(+)
MNRISRPSNGQQTGQPAMDFRRFCRPLRIGGRPGLHASAIINEKQTQTLVLGNLVMMTRGVMPDLQLISDTIQDLVDTRGSKE